MDNGCFPFSTWAQLSRRVLSEYSARLLEATDPRGALSLRQEIAHYLHDFRGITVSPENIVVGAGLEYLIGLLIQLLGRDRVYALENPGYRKLYQIVTQNSAPIRPIPLDKSGLRADVLSESDASVVYLTPSHHFPLGTVMPVGRRLELLRWAAGRPGRYIIEDDYDSEFRYASRPIPALRDLDREGRVIYVNTFSRSLAPGLRIGYLVLPDALMMRYRERFSLYSATVSSFDQQTLAAFMQSGGFERHISRSRKVYQARRDALMAAIEREFSALPHEISRSEAGLHLLLHMRSGMLERELIDHVFRHKNAEIAAKSCLSGPHKDDLELMLDGRSAASFGSQGQVRTCTLSLKLAERELFFEEDGEYPVLLLDDVLSELDRRRQDFVLNRIPAGQVMITCCEDGISEKLRAGAAFHIQNGKIV